MRFNPGCQCCPPDCCTCEFGGLQYGSVSDFNCPDRRCLPLEVCLNFLFPQGSFDCSLYYPGSQVIRPYTLTWQGCIDPLKAAWYSEDIPLVIFPSPTPQIFNWILQCGYSPGAPLDFYTLTFQGPSGAATYQSSVGILKCCSPFTLNYDEIDVLPVGPSGALCCSPTGIGCFGGDPRIIRAVVTEGACTTDLGPIQYYSCLDGVCVEVVSGTEFDYDCLYTDILCDGDC